MTRWPRTAAGLAAAVLALAACTAGDAPAAAPPVVAAAPTAGTAPPPDAPPLVLRGAVDLSPATAGVPSSVAGAVAAPDGGAYAVLRPDDGAGPLRVVTVDAAARLVRSVPAPPMAQVWGVHRLPSGEVLVAGQFPRPDRGYGFVAVDPVGGAARTVVAVPFEEGTDLSVGHSALSPDGGRFFELVSIQVGERPLDLLVAVDPATGRFLAGRDVRSEVLQVSVVAIGFRSAWLLPRPAGGVTLVFDAHPRTDVGGPSSATLVGYDADLEPDGPAMPVQPPSEGADAQAATGGADGAVWLTVQPPAGDRIVSVSGRSVSRPLELGGHGDDDAMAVDPTGSRAVLPALGGARAVDLRTGATGRLDLGCRSAQPVRDVVPAADPAGVLLVGACDVPAPGTPMLWLAGG